MQKTLFAQVRKIKGFCECAEIFRGRLRRPEKNRGKNRVKPRRTHTNHGSLVGGGVKNSNNMGGFSIRPRGFSIRHRVFLGGTPKKTPHGNGKIAWVFLLKPRNSPKRPVIKPSHNKRTGFSHPRWKKTRC